MKLLIVGAGLGGLTLAAYLEFTGIDYLLIDKYPPSPDRGYSLGIWSNTRQLLAPLGLDKPLAAMGCPITRYDICNSRGRLLRRYDFNEFYRRYGTAYTQIRRHDLLQLIGSKINPSRARWRKTASQVTPGIDGVRVTFDDGQAELFDLVVGADGVHSIIRSACFEGQLSNPTGWRAYYTWMDRRFIQPGSMREYLGPGKCLGVFDDGDRALAIFFLSRQRRNNFVLGNDKLELARHFQEELAHLAQAANAGSLEDDPLAGVSISTADLYSTHLHQWFADRCILLGDAVHAFEPHTGLGASMAMEDAFILAQALRKISDGAPLIESLSQYQRRRHPRIEIARRLNGRIGRLAFVNSSLVRRLANQMITRAPRRFFTAPYFQLLDSSAEEPRTQ